MVSDTKHIVPSEWERHRDTIVSLRRSGTVLEGEEGIIAVMRRDHEFIASSSQYELQLNKWEERKNLHADEWRQIIQTVDQCNENGIKCNVYRNGQLIPQRTLKRKRKEYCKGHEYIKRRQVRVAASSLPEFIEVRTSPSANQAHDDGDFNIHEDLSVGNCAITTSITEPNTDATALYVTEVGRCEAVDLVSDSLIVTSSSRPQEHTALADTSLAKTRHTQSLGSPLPWTACGASADAFPPELDSLTPMHQQSSFAEIGPGVEVDTDFSLARLSNVAGCSTSNKCFTFEPRPASRNAIEFGFDTSLGEILNLDLIDTWAPRIPFLQFEEHLQSQGNLYLNAKFAASIQQPADNRQRDFMSLDYAEESRNIPRHAFLTQARSILVQGNPSTSNDALEYPEMFRSTLLSLLPPDAISPVFNFQPTIQHQAFPSSFHRLLTFSTANNFVGLEGAPMGVVLKFLAKDIHMHSQLMKYLRASPKYFCKSLVENLIRAAIEDCDATLVTALMSTGFVTPDEIVCPIEGERYTAVERSAMLQSTEVTKALLLAGADVNKTYLPVGGALTSAMLTRSKSGPVDVQLVNLLLECGANVDPGVLYLAVCARDADLVRSLMSKFSPSQRHEYLQAHPSCRKLPGKVARSCPDWLGFIVRAVEVLDYEFATMIVTQMLQACLQTRCGKCPKLSTELRRSISIAAMRGFSEIVVLLLEYTPKKDFPLIEAVRSGQKDLIELLLKQGADVDTPASCMVGRDRRVYTPLAEAIRGGNNELVQDFENRGALSCIREGGRFRAAIYAAAKVKNTAYAQRLLRVAPDIPGETLDLALEVSIKEGHEELALLLLGAGADVNVEMRELRDNAYVDKEDIASLMALRQKNEILVRAVMNCSMRVMPEKANLFDSPLLLAARWGNLCVIRDLLSMGADVDGDGKIDDVRREKVNTDDDDDEIDSDHFYHDNYLRETAVTAAVKESNKPLVELLVYEHQASLNLFSDRKTSPLASAISNKDIDMFRYLLELGADPACHSAFRKAISGDREMLPELLRAFRAKYPAGKTGFGGVPLRIAIRSNNEQVLNALLKAKLDVNAFAIAKSERLNCLGTAMREHGRHDLEIIRKLLFAGSDPNGIAATANGFWKSQGWLPGTSSSGVPSVKTALLEAISTKNKALVELLVEAGADINRPAQPGIRRTPLQHACEVGSLEIVELLLDRGADVNEKPTFRGGGTSLQLCAIAGYAGIADKLLKHGANVHAARPEMRGRTAFEGAAEHGRLDMLKILWDATAGQGFDSEQIDSAIKLAEGNGHFACRDLIQELHFTSRAFIMPVPFNI